ncbi:MAG: phosphatase PAP2 family protein [Lachnospiraceae bacterium]|jgi:membrane-associated phospholipid phosphatase|nr:phosphatase PAP2 family protein [Lachnospiraceae bacterium]
MKAFFHKYKHAIPLLIYAPVYMIWFGHLEKTVKHYKLIHVALDDYIPFCEVFIVPYLLWFLYVAATVAFFFFKDKDDYYKCCAFLFAGMTVFLLVSTLWPNGHRLRPFIFPRDNIFTKLVSMIYRADTPTNLWPSIHVYNSLGCHFAIAKSRHFAKHKGIRNCSLVLCISIILSTMFTKQHSAFDVITAFVMAAVMYLLVYRFDILLNLKHNLNHKNKRKMGPETL